MKIQNLIDEIESFIVVPSVDKDPDGAIRSMEILLRIVELRTEVNKISSKPMLCDSAANFPCLDYLHGQERCTQQCENCKP